jgi:membrane-associated phospholipid phosphatase
MPRRAPLYLLGAAFCAGLLILTWFAALHVSFVERADASVLRGFSGLQGHSHVDGLASRLASLCDPRPYVLLCAIPVVMAIARRRLWTLAAIAVILLGANLTTALLKPLLAHPRLDAHALGVSASATHGSWPSGHATAAMALALCCMLAAPGRVRPYVAAVGAGFAVVVSYSFLTLKWHYPSDAVGGFLVAATWTSFVVAAVLFLERRRGLATDEPQQRLSLREALGPPGAALLAVLALIALAIVARPHQVVAYAQAHRVFIAGAAAIGALALGLATSMMLPLRR